MTHPVLTPIIIFDYPPLKDVPCAFQGDGTDTTWMGSSIITSGQSALAAKAKGPRDRSNPWGNFLHRLLPEGEIEVKYLHDIATKALPSDFSQDHHCVSAIHAATWFMGCKPPRRSNLACHMGSRAAPADTLPLLCQRGHAPLLYSRG